MMNLSSHNAKKSSAGFSLLELSIVLAVIGIIVGGVLLGQQLVRSSELRALVEDRERVQSAVLAFKERYNTLPGDMTNATFFWGAAHATLANCKTTVGTGTQTCNGDGDGKAGLDDSLADTSNDYEYFRAMQHLANAGLIEGKYTGVAGSGGASHAVPGTNVPASRIAGGGYTLKYIGTVAGHASLFDGSYKHVYTVGAATAASDTGGPILKPIEALNIDRKVDDGLPAAGTVTALKSSAATTPLCSTTDVATTSVYNIGIDATLCSIRFKAGF